MSELTGVQHDPQEPLLVRLRASRPALALALAVAVLSVVNRLAAHAFGYRGQPVWMDLDVYRRGVASWLAGEPLAGPFWFDYANASLPFTYPPVAAAILIPVTWGPLPVIGAIWTVGCLISLWLSLFLLARWGRLLVGDAGLLSFFVLAVAVNLEPVVSHLEVGQIGLPLMCLVIVDHSITWKRWPRGLLTGLAVAVKLAPAIFFLYFLVRRDWKGLATAAATAVLLTVFGFLVAPADSFAFWSGLSDLDGQVAVFDWTSNVSLRGVLQRLPLGHEAIVWLVLVFAAVLLAGRVMLRSLEAGWPEIALVANGILMPLITPTAWGHHWVWLAALLLVAITGALRGSAVLGALAFGTALVFCETGLNGSVPGSWLLYVAWGVIVFIVLGSRSAYPALCSDCDRSSEGHTGL